MAIRKGYHRTKSGKIAKKGLWYNVKFKERKKVLADQKPTEYNKCKSIQKFLGVVLIIELG